MFDHRTLPFFLLTMGCGRFLELEPIGVDADGGTVVAGPLDSVTSVGETDGGTFADAIPTPYVFVPSMKLPSFVDVFSRPDGPTIGNDWTEKTDSFSLVGGAVERVGMFSHYTNVMMLRPSTEPVLDVEISVGFTYANTNDDPYLLARIQPESDQPGRLKGYQLRVHPTMMSVYLQYAQFSVTTIDSSPLLPALVVGEAYRLTFRVMGKDPVLVEGAILRPDGSVVGSVKGEDGTANRIIVSGRLGFGVSESAGGRFDDFRRIDL